MDFQIVREKLDQAAGLLAENEVDLWLTLARETSLTRDPTLDLIVGLGVTWQSAFLVSRSGERLAIVGRFDVENVQATQAYAQVIGYDQSLRPALLEALARLDPKTIAVNYSESDPAADGLTHGLWLALRAMLAGTPYADRLVSAENLISGLRGRKSATEIQRIRAAVRASEKLFAVISNRLKPGVTERQIADQLTNERRRLGLGAAWDEPYCPIVNAGPESPIGHAAPGRHRTRRGQLLHIDFGVQRDGYCSDLQRVWYLLEKGERRAPDDVRRAWEACWAAIDAGAAKLRPGVAGWEVDEAARQSLVAAGYPEFQHALGHGLGRVAHDGATLLGPRWEKYGRAPLGVVEAGNVFTLELGTPVPGRGFIGIEEDVLVTEAGLEWLSKPQRKIWLG